MFTCGDAPDLGPQRRSRASDETRRPGRLLFRVASAREHAQRRVRRGHTRDNSQFDSAHWVRAGDGARAELCTPSVVSGDRNSECTLLRRPSKQPRALHKAAWLEGGVACSGVESARRARERARGTSSGRSREARIPVRSAVTRGRRARIVRHCAVPVRNGDVGGNTRRLDAAGAAHLTPLSRGAPFYEEQPTCS